MPDRSDSEQCRVARRVWSLGILTLTLVPLVLAIVAAPEGAHAAGPVLAWLLIVGYTGHVASTAWLGSYPEVRALAHRQPVRLLLAPVLLIFGSAALACAVPARSFSWFLLVFFAWQFFHFQKQNLGMVALTASAQGAGPLRSAERRAISLAGTCGILGLLAHPALLDLTVADHLQWAFPVARDGACLVAVAGLAALIGRSAHEAPLVAAYGVALVFFFPVFVFRSPFAAVSGMVIAHGLQYLWVQGAMARGPRSRRSGGPDRAVPGRAARVAVLACVAVSGGAVLNALSGLHASSVTGARALYGVYLGIVMAHFVIDTVVWRLRDDHARRFVTSRLPFLVMSRPAASAPN